MTRFGSPQTSIYFHPQMLDNWQKPLLYVPPLWNKLAIKSSWNFDSTAPVQHVKPKDGGSHCEIAIAEINYDQSIRFLVLLDCFQMVLWTDRVALSTIEVFFFFHLYVKLFDQTKFTKPLVRYSLLMPIAMSILLSKII